MSHACGLPASASGGAGGLGEQLDQARAQAAERARASSDIRLPLPDGETSCCDSFPAGAMLRPAQANLQEGPHVKLLTLENAAGGPTSLSALAEGPAPTQEAPASQPSVRVPIFSIKEDIKHIPRDLWQDTERTFTNPFGLMLLGTTGGASAALRVHVDETITDHHRHSRTCKAAWGDAANALGSPILDAGVSLAWYYVGYETQDLRTYSVGKTLISAYVINGLSTLTLRLATNAHGPGDARYNWPSGHTSCTFTLAAVLDHSYGPVVGVPMYAFASWVGFERIDDRQHKLSDVIFGAVLGLVIGHGVAAGHMPQIKGGYIVPYADPEEGTAGIAWWKSWK